VGGNSGEQIRCHPPTSSPDTSPRAMSAVRRSIVQKSMGRPAATLSLACVAVHSICLLSANAAAGPPETGDALRIAATIRGTRIKLPLHNVTGGDLPPAILLIQPCAQWQMPQQAVQDLIGSHGPCHNSIGSSPLTVINASCARTSASACRSFTAHEAPPCASSGAPASSSMACNTGSVSGGGSVCAETLHAYPHR